MIFVAVCFLEVIRLRRPLSFFYLNQAMVYDLGRFTEGIRGFIRLDLINFLYSMFSLYRHSEL